MSEAGQGSEGIWEQTQRTQLFSSLTHTLKVVIAQPISLRGNWRPHYLRYTKGEIFSLSVERNKRQTSFFF